MRGVYIIGQVLALVLGLVLVVAGCEEDSGPELATCEEETDKLTECDPTGAIYGPCQSCCEDYLAQGDDVEECVLSCDVDLSCNNYMSCVEDCLP